MTFTDDFDFNDYINDEQDVALVADNHLFGNGEDLYGYAPVAPGSSLIPQDTTGFSTQGINGDPYINLSALYPPIEPNSSLIGKTFDFPQDTTGLSTQGVNGDPYTNHMASYPPTEPEGVGHSTSLMDPTQTTIPVTSAVNPAPVLDDSYSYSGVADDLYQGVRTTEQRQWETNAIESMQTFFELQPELQPDARVEDWLMNQNQIEPSSQQIQGPQAQYNFIPGATTQLPQTFIPVDPQPLHERTQTNPPIEVASSPDIPLPSKSRTKPHTKRDTRRTRTPGKRNSGLTTSDDAIPGLSFSSLRDAEIAMTSRHMEYDWEPPAPDGSIPNTKIERSLYVLNILTAFQDTSTCKENKHGSSFRKRWMSADYYDVQDIEKVCWHILSIAERVHTEGPSALKIYCAEAQRKVNASRNFTFNERIEAICDCLKYSKSICDNLMKAEGIEILVGSPKLRMNSARTMLPQNVKRQQWMAQGRNADPTHVSTRAGRGSFVVDVPVQVGEAAPLKRKRETKQPKRPKGAAKSQSEPTAPVQIDTALDASLPNSTPSQPTAPAKGYAPAQTRAPPQIAVPPQSPASVNEPSQLLRQLSAGLQPSFENTPAPAPLPYHLSQPSEPSAAPKPLKPGRSNPGPLFDALTKDAPAQTSASSASSASEPSQPVRVRKPRIKCAKDLKALLADGNHSKAVSEAHSLLQTKKATKTTTDNAPKTKEYLDSVYDESDSEESARPTKRQRKTDESVPSKKPESGIARRLRQRKAKTTINKQKPTTVVKPAIRFSPPSVKPKASAAPKSTPPVSKKRKAIPDADSEDEAEAPRHAKRTKTSTTEVPKSAFKTPCWLDRTGKALRKKVTFALDDEPKSSPAKSAPVKTGKSLRQKVVIEISDDELEPVKKKPVKKGKAASTTKNTRKSAPVKSVPVKKRKAMRKIPATEDSDNLDDEFVLDSDHDSGSDFDE
jgi:hypothetical protein